MIVTSTNYKSQEIGGKAKALAELGKNSFDIPDWFVISPDHELNDPTIFVEAERLGASSFAVRSSAIQEDGVEHSFAG